MIKKKIPDIQSQIKEISDILLMNGGFLNNPGLYTGEFGLVLFFTRYARFTQNEMYSDYAYDLIEKIQKRIDLDTSINYIQGLTGIGSAFEYLVQNGFIEADIDEVLEDFDKRIFLAYNPQHLSVEEIIDVGCYALWRMSGNSIHKKMIRYTILPSIVNNMKTLGLSKDVVLFERITKTHDNSFTLEWHQLCQNVIPKGFWEQSNFYFTELFMENVFFDKENIHMGLQNGLAGCGISLLTKLDKDNSWISLLPYNFYTTNDESIPV